MMFLADMTQSSEARPREAGKAPAPVPPAAVRAGTRTPRMLSDPQQEMQRDIKAPGGERHGLGHTPLGEAHFAFSKQDVRRAADAHAAAVRPQRTGEGSDGKECG